MSRTVTALFDSRAEADAARTRLTQSRIDADNIRIMDRDSGGGAGDQDKGFFDSLKDFFIPDEDAHAYREGVSRGGFMLCAQVDEDCADEAIRILDEADSVDFDQRQQEWRSDGWTGFAGRTDTGAFSGAGMGASGQGAVIGDGASRDGRESGNMAEEQRIPIVEEELKVGKREVARGGARVRSYIREVPVHDEVALREEHVSVERRPVAGMRAAEVGDDAFRDRTIEMTETAEEAVVAKEARVREELVVKKTSEEHVEQIDDTVRRTEVEVDEDRGGKDRSAFGGFAGGARPGSASSEPQRDFERTDKDRF